MFLIDMSSFIAFVMVNEIDSKLDLLRLSKAPVILCAKYAYVSVPQLLRGC